MEETKFVRVTHGGEAHFVALYTGLNPAEVSRLLQAAFKLPQHVIGLMHKAGISESEQERGVVVPLSLACRTPQMLGDRSYSLLLSDKEVPWEKEKPKTVNTFTSTSSMRPNLAQGSPIALEWQTTSSSAGLGLGNGREHALAHGRDQAKRGPAEVARAGTGGGRQVKPAVRTLWEPDDEGEEEEQAEDGGDKAEDKERIVAFIRRMAFNGLLTRDDQNALESSAMAGDVVINAAFAVALHSQDLDYLSALFKDIATNRRDNPQGIRLLEAKREMLDMVEVLHQADEVDDDQLVYLQNLILVSNETVTEAFGVYEEDQDPVRLAESLKQLCGAEAEAEAEAPKTGLPGAVITNTNSHGSDGDSEDDGDDGNNDDDDDDDGDDDDENALCSESERSAMKATVWKVAINLTNEGLLGAREASAVNDMIKRQNPVLVAAFKLFQEDGNAAELYDTVARAARFEAQRIAGASRATGGGGEVGPAGRLLETSAPRVAAAGVRGARGLKGEGSHFGTGAAAGGIGGDGDADGHADGDGGEMDHAEALAGFQRLVTVAVQKGVMGMSDARVICSAFESGLSGEAGRLQELVHAAWGVYSTGGGEEDALDSLVRIIRLAVKPFQPGNPATATAARGKAVAADRDAPASVSTAELRDSMSVAVSAIAVQSAHLLLQNNKVSAEEASCLASPSPGGCQAILGALEVFEENCKKDVLLDTFAAIAKAELTKRKRRGNGEGQGPEQEQEERAGSADEDDDGDDDDEEDEEDRPIAAEQEGADDDDDDNEDDDDDDDDDDEQDDDGQEFSDRATVELMELVECMAGDKRIGGKEQSLLARLIENKHPGIMVAYTNYAATQDVSALVSALMTIVRTQGADGDAVSPSAATATRQIYDQREGEDEKEGGAGDGDEGAPLSSEKQENQNGRERVVLLMHETRVLTASDATRVLLLLAREDPNTLATFEAFDSSKDVASLVESIKSILHEAPPIAPADLNMAMHSDGDRSNSSPLLRQILQPLTLADTEADTRTEACEEGDEDDAEAVGDDGDDDDDDDDDGHGGSPNDDDNDEAVAETVVSIVDGMGLDENEAAALRLAIASGDANMRGALELFRLDSDAEELKDTIARVARLMLQREREAGVTNQGPGASGEMNGAGEGANVTATVDTASAVEARTLDFTLDGKEGLFQELLQQLGCVGVMSEAQGAVIMDRYRNKDAVVFAALDVYKNENDMAELVDTLKRLT